MVVGIRNYLVVKNDRVYLADYPHLKAELVARMHVNGHVPIEQVAAHYHIPLAQVYAALAYYYDNQLSLDARYAEIWTESEISEIYDADNLRAKIEARM